MMSDAANMGNAARRVSRPRPRGRIAVSGHVPHSREEIDFAAQASLLGIQKSHDIKRLGEIS
jgi:hypothetical protein